MPAELVEGVLGGSRRALARLLTHVEQGEANSALRLLYPHTGRGWIIGITGSPGSGKSSLVNALTQHYRSAGETVAILAVDPTSPFTGGAILGDRIRMRDLSGDSGVFIRSMATRGSLGGLARTTRDMARALDAAGFDRIVIETVGAGQSEVEIARVAYTTVVVEAPGMGDDVQAIKAGILEIADVLVVNKADHVGAAQTVRALTAMLELGHPPQRVMHHGQYMTVAAADRAAARPWLPPVVQTVAIERRGIDALADAIDAHRQHRIHTLGVTDPAALRTELLERAREQLFRQWLNRLPPATIEAFILQIQQRALDPQTAVDRLLSSTIDTEPPNGTV